MEKLKKVNAFLEIKRINRNKMRKVPKFPFIMEFDRKYKVNSCLAVHFDKLFFSQLSK